jgi:hypothetical protein
MKSGTTDYTEGTDRPLDQSNALHVDILRGATQIAEFLFGTTSAKGVRRVYHLAETSKIPVFKLGSVLCARRSVLVGWIASQEARSTQGSPQ